MKDFEFPRVILILIFAFLILIQLSDSCSVSPDAETVLDIETTGLDATCKDLIGEWGFMGSSLRWEFREDGWFRETQTNFFNNNSGDFSCDEVSKMVLVPQSDDYVGTHPYQVKLGKISDGHMIIFVGSKGRTEVIVKE